MARKKKGKIDPASKRLTSVQMFKIRQAAIKFGEAIRDDPNMMIDDILKLVFKFKGITISKFLNCEKCSRKLTRKQCYRACIYCGYNNRLIADRARRREKKAREAENLRLLEQQEPMDQGGSNGGYTPFW